MKDKRNYHIYALVDGEIVLLQESSVRFSRANRAALKAVREGKKGVFFAYSLDTERHKPHSPFELFERETEAQQQRRNRSQLALDEERVDFYRSVRGARRLKRA